MDKYTTYPKLKNAVAGARALEMLLRSKKVRVFCAYDCDIEQLQRTRNRFLSSLQPGDAALVLFVGHGCEFLNVLRLTATGATNPTLEANSLNMNVLCDRLVR